jgi:hypothetical protein
MSTKVTLSDESVDSIMLDGLRYHRKMTKQAIKDILKIKKKKDVDYVDLASNQQYLEHLEAVIKEHMPPVI